MRFTERILGDHSLHKRLGVKTKTFPHVDENKRATYTTEGCGNVEVTIGGAPAKDIRRACAVDPANTRKLLALVRKDSEPSYRRNRVGFAAILKGKKYIMLLARRSLLESQAPPPVILSAAGVAVIYQLGMGWPFG